jgi:hypothetical protein
MNLALGLLYVVRGLTVVSGVGTVAGSLWLFFALDESNYNAIPIASRVLLINVLAFLLTLFFIGAIPAAG